MVNRTLFVSVGVLVMAAHAAAVAGQERPVVVNPRAHGGGTVATISEGLEMAVSGGRVLVTPGVYEEALTIEKGVTLEAAGGSAGAVVINPPGLPSSTIEIKTGEPVVL